VVLGLRDGKDGARCRSSCLQTPAIRDSRRRCFYSATSDHGERFSNSLTFPNLSPVQLGYFGSKDKAEEIMSENKPIQTKTKIMPSKIIRINMSKEEAYRLKQLMDGYAKRYCFKFDSQTARLIAHKMWILCYHATFNRAKQINPLPASFTCMTPSWIRFCKEVVQAELGDHPGRLDLVGLLYILDSGKEIKSC
jgi:hypothetical protein